MTPERAIRTIALRDVLAGDPAYRRRRVLRWYAREFSCLPHQVEELPWPDVLQAYWENHYERLQEQGEEGAQAIQQERAWLARTDKEALEAANAEDAQEVEMEEYRQAELRAEAKRQAKAAAVEAVVTDLPPDVELSFDEPSIFENLSAG